MTKAGIAGAVGGLALALGFCLFRSADFKNAALIFFGAWGVGLLFALFLFLLRKDVRDAPLLKDTHWAFIGSVSILLVAIVVGLSLLIFAPAPTKYALQREENGGTSEWVATFDSANSAQNGFKCTELARFLSEANDARFNCDSVQNRPPPWIPRSS